MNLLNATKMQAGYTMGIESSGRELLVVVVKGTFTIPKAGEKPQLAEEQVPLFEADQFTGEPGFSAPLYESDYAPRKPRCDVLLNGSAYAPGGQSTTEVTVGLQVRSMQKMFRVVGNRHWKRGMVSVSATSPEPFVKMPISYNNAFGGTDTTHSDPAKHSAFMANPVGKGFFNNADKDLMDGKPLPNTEELNHPVKKPNDQYHPMAFGPLGRGWYPRYTLAGTYDQDWLDNVFPFLPGDFQDAYYQAAPPDQQIDYLKGGERVVLMNLTPEGKTVFEIPRIEMPVVFLYKNRDELETQARIDTLVIEPDNGIFTLTWRSTVALKRNMFEITKIVAGKMPDSYYRAKRLGKTYYRSLGELVKTQNE